jgi:hypothetical protein
MVEIAWQRLGLIHFLIICEKVDTQSINNYDTITDLITQWMKDQYVTIFYSTLIPSAYSSFLLTGVCTLKTLKSIVSVFSGIFHQVFSIILDDFEITYFHGGKVEHLKLFHPN